MTNNRCISCSQTVRRRQEALQCDSCSRWQHRKCGTGISRELYRNTVQGEGIESWNCINCNTTTDITIAAPTQESTRLDEPAAYPETEDQEEIQPADSSSFNITQRSFQIPPVNLEESIEDIQPQESQPDAVDISYHLTTNGSTRNKRKLADSIGYTFTVKRQRPNGTVDWWCSVRGKSSRCPATVIQTGSDFRPGTHQHNHDSAPGAITKLKIVSQVKQEAASDPFKSASQIVKDAVSSHSDHTLPAGSRPNMHNLQRSTNRQREKTRPKDPKTLDFEVNYDYIPDNFLRKDVKVGNNRHLIFATNNQLDVLANSKVWYMDGTFKIIKKPFTQMFSIHAFLRTGDDTKQVPLVFCMMSSRTKKDYKKVFKKVVKLLPSNPKVKEFVVDFEQGSWLAIKSMFPNAVIKGCAFHWGQAIWRHVQSLGLQVQYRQHDGVYKYVRKLMAICYLPHEHIISAFTRLQEQINGTDTPKLQELTKYVHDTWITSSVWPIASWTVFMRPTRTNNDVEGWHNRINKDKKAGAGNKGLYTLAPLLHTEAELLPDITQLVSEGKLKKIQRKQTKTMQKLVFDHWQQYIDNDISVSRLLRLCARLVYVPDQ